VKKIREALKWLLTTVICVIFSIIILFVMLADEYGLVQPYKHYFEVATNVFGIAILSVFALLIIVVFINEHLHAKDKWPC
jgi:hypothetical protein